ncbi:hypothetical protein E1301_Tti020712 [Triplophysa tibetana]|uniref:Uncharacterized protein n=1 Tax=Triplophysa tibetana TaxID=1572043 RepID=A0A5A9PHZ9_9TELE|nr:hypothetical protein E1301_Tti020712 [Triplophysa tibetana]
MKRLRSGPPEEALGAWWAAGPTLDCVPGRDWGTGPEWVADTPEDPSSEKELNQGLSTLVLEGWGSRRKRAGRMEYHTSLVLLFLIISPSSSAGTVFFTYLGTLCIEDCKHDGYKYTCKSFDKDGSCQTMYCSPQKNMDYLGRQCKANSMCEKHGKGYNWCYNNVWGQWGYCGLVMDNNNHYGSKQGSLCYDHCDKRQEEYYWCNTVTGWDYCSPSEKTDYKNKRCKEDSPCGKHGQNYNWCWLKEGSWGYCGLQEPKMLLYRTKDNYICTDECQYHERSDYYWCHTAKDWDYCSPDVNVTYKGKPCRSDHSCGLNDYGYNWCWTSENEYDYCGRIEPGVCTYTTSQHRKRRAPEDRKLICTRIDKGNKIKTIFTAEEASNDIAEVNQNRKEEAKKLIGLWNNGYLVNQARSNLIASEHLRIDMQGIINRNNRRYYNLQVQLNTNRGPNQSTTVSQILVPDGIPDSYIRRAFWESLINRARIFVEVLTLNQC